MRAELTGWTGDLPGDVGGGMIARATDGSQGSAAHGSRGRGLLEEGLMGVIAHAMEQWGMLRAMR